MQAHGSATSSSVYAMYPIIRSQGSNLSGTLIWEDKKLNDQTGAPVTSIDKHVEIFSLGLSGNQQNGPGSGLTLFDVTMVSGSLGMDAASLATDAASAKSNGAFTRLTYSISRQQRLTVTNTLSLAVSGQQASKNLNSSEKFTLGGIYGVRAYPQGEGSGDEGWLANLELRHDIAEAMQGVLFYDTGSVAINSNPYVSGVANTRDISGVGAGLNYNLAGVQLKACLAWRTSGGMPASEPQSADRNPRLWVQVGKQF